jgi:hypothetical protein
MKAQVLHKAKMKQVKTVMEGLGLGDPTLTGKVTEKGAKKTVTTYWYFTSFGGNARVYTDYWLKNLGPPTLPAGEIIVPMDHNHVAWRMNKRAREDLHATWCSWYNHRAYGELDACWDKIVDTSSRRQKLLSPPSPRSSLSPTPPTTSLPSSPWAR